MATYVTLYKLTEKGVTDIKGAPKRIRDGLKAYEAIGGKVHAFYATQGEYDYVAIGEHPDEMASVAYTLGLGSRGTVRTTTMRAFSVEEFEEIVSKIP